MRRFSDPSPILPNRPTDPHALEASRQTTRNFADLQGQLDLLTGINAPTATAKSAAGSTVSGSCKITGNDVAGVLTLRTGTGMATGILAAVTFSKPRPAAPFSIVLFPANPKASQAVLYVDPANVTTEKWSISATTALTASTVYMFHFRVSSP